jgi:hypothetical protein
MIVPRRYCVAAEHVHLRARDPSCLKGCGRPFTTRLFAAGLDQTGSANNVVIRTSTSPVIVTAYADGSTDDDPLSAATTGDLNSLRSLSYGWPPSYASLRPARAAGAWGPVLLAASGVEDAPARHNDSRDGKSLSRTRHPASRSVPRVDQSPWRFDDRRLWGLPLHCQA